METPLTDAIDRGDLELAARLLRSGEDPNQPNGFGESPLMVAAMSRSTSALELLAAHGAEVNRSYKDGWTALHAAVDHSIDSTIQKGGTPGEEPTEAVLWLLKHGADLGKKTDQGETALDFAESYNSSTMVTILRRPQPGYARDA
ncbi:ankyrin repeat domain-containing protein [Piscinibacter gummiphilus]|uniref:Uncharacterized protein n=1 Tax=Piscinibacter gummiphilus TaxID=946333 RepID=A0A1W6LC46_9BURK|nr:ankyrin repeat domain-containing protein [Piscinibacter gummiphilus]ARN21829.1 hypothetical protein A4W93_19075 [Piscinibacter gummiphilus]ATU66515.1 ankyrin repeat domain-containing protein [Piscinibacter gummiphilus]GLS93873.1 hypothetical protein GCM10007918_11650 [Piscinibacter gummiphilus]